MMEDQLRALIRNSDGRVSRILHLEELKWLSSAPELITELVTELVTDPIVLEELWLRSNDLTELPTSLNKLENLKLLELEDNKLSRVPDVVIGLSKLEVLGLANNNLTELPTSINKLKNLKCLNLNYNKFPKFPDAVNDLSELEWLKLDGNNLTELPTSIKKLKNLTRLSLANNKFSMVPDVVAELIKLERLYMGSNNLTELPTSINKLKSLKGLYLNNNKLSKVPYDDMEKLEFLGVSGNPFTIDALRSLLKLKEKKKGKIYIEITERDTVVPAEIEARGQRAQLAYQKALSDGAVNVCRSRLFLIGQDGAGKTSLKKSLIGLPFDPEEQSTKGIEVNPSTFQVDVNQVKNWNSSDKHKQRLLGGSKEFARVMVQNLQNDSDDYSNDNSDDNRKKQKTKTKNIDRDDSDASGDLDDETAQEEDDDSYIEQVAEQNIDKVSEHKSTQPELMVNATLPPDEITNNLIKYYLKKLIESDIEEGETIYALDLWDFAGQHLYYASHPIFFSLRGIYVLVYNLSKPINAIAKPCLRQELNNISKLKNPNGETNVENLLSWFVTVDGITQMRGETVDSAQGRPPYLRPPVIIVGTHADKPFEDIESMKTQIQKIICETKCGGHMVAPIFSIDNTTAGKMRTTLHKHLLQKEDPLTFDNYYEGRWQCNECDRISDGTSHPFHCIQCDHFDLCDSCAHANMIKDNVRTTLHEHLLQKEDPLTFDNYHEGRWQCNNCDGTSDGTSHPFHCFQCFQRDQYDLCHSCAHANMIKGEPNSCTEIQALQDKIIEVLRQEPYMRQRIPARWVQFEKIFKTLVEQNTYYIDKKKLQTHAKDECSITDTEEFSTMMDFYHDLGVIIKHGSTVILKAQWLIDLFRQLITIPCFNDADPKVRVHWNKVQKSGVLSMELVDHVFEKFLLQNVVRDDILNMMEQFGLIAKYSTSSTDATYFVPAQLNAPPDCLSTKEPLRSDPCPLYVKFVNGFVPHGLFGQLVSRLIHWCSVAGPTQPPKLYQNAACFHIGRQIIHRVYLICKMQFIKIVLKQITQSQQDNSTEVATNLKEVLEKSFKDLKQDLPYLHGLQFQFCVLCPHCQLEKCANHTQVKCTHSECLHLLEMKEGKPLMCDESLCDEELTVHGLEKWFPQRTSQELNPSTSLGAAESHYDLRSKKFRKRKSPCKEDDAVWQMTSDAQPTQGPAKVSRYEAPATTGQAMDDIQPTQVRQIFNLLQQMEQDAHKGTSNTDLSLGLKKIASDKGFLISNNEGGGNCMFHALSEQLDLVKGMKTSHQELRNKVVNYLKNNPTLPDGTELFNFVDGYSSWNAYLENMAVDGTWGDHVILHGAANYFETCIHVISSLSHHNDVIINPEHAVTSSNQLVLGHVHELHYVSLIPLTPAVKEGCPSDDELERLSRRIKEWKSLGRRLKFDKGILHGFHKDNEEWSEKAYAMLITWKEREGSAATYQVLQQALCHELVNRRDLAEEFCCHASSRSSLVSWK